MELNILPLSISREKDGVLLQKAVADAKIQLIKMARKKKVDSEEIISCGRCRIAVNEAMDVRAACYS